MICVRDLTFPNTRSPETHLKQSLAQHSNEGNPKSRYTDMEVIGTYEKSIFNF